jgi:putative two-component system response regulator
MKNAFGNARALVPSSLGGRVRTEVGRRAPAAALRVVLVDDDPLALAITRRLLTRSGYEVVPCDHARTALREMIEEPPFALIADLHMPDLNGAELLQLARSMFPGTRRILYTAESEVRELSRAVAPRVADAIVAKSDVSERLPQALSDLRAEQAYAAAPEEARSVALSIARALGSGSVEPLDHALRVARWARHLGGMAGLDEPALNDLELGALLHDVGMICVPEASLRFPGPLGEHDWRLIRRHPLVGANILKGCPGLEGAIPVLLYHHERYDGRGYPHGLSGTDIPLSARLFSVIDTYDALTHARPYAPRASDAEAREEIARQRGMQFDPMVAELFLSCDPDAWKNAARFSL